MNNAPTGHSTIPLKRSCLSLLLAFVVASANAAPAVPQVVAGQATFNQQGNVFSITNTPNTIINWQSFSINAGEITRFIQQNASSSVLNRIVGQDPSQILGALQSNGKVFLINPNGILFGRDARIDVNGLVASSLNLSNEDFLAGRRNFSALPAAGKVSNAGQISTPSGGQVFLIAPSVENSGVITAPNGEVMLAAGHTVQLVDAASPEVHIVVSAPDNAALNLGQVIAQGGRIGIFGALVNQQGRLNADSVVAGENGKIYLKASRDTLLEAGSVTTAAGAGKGGEIQLLGDRVGLTGDALVDASGQAGGGTVLIGGDYQGKNAAVPNAQQTYVGKDALIKADAIAGGDGGKVIVWSDRMTRFDGRLSATGGAVSGNGGFAEVSGKDILDFQGMADLRALHGTSGTLLLDPSDLTISTGTNSASALGGSPFVFDAGASNSVLNTSTLAAQLGSSAVNVTASGTITVASPLPYNSANALTMNAANGNAEANAIIVNSPITNSGAGRLTLIAAEGDITQGIGAPITANSMSLNATNGNVNLDLAAAGNSVGTLAGIAGAGSGNGFNFTNAGNLTIASVGSTTGIVTSDLPVNLTVNSGNLTLADTIDTNEGAVALTSSAGNIIVNNGVSTATGPLRFTAGGSITHDGTMDIRQNGVVFSATGGVTLTQPLTTGQSLAIRAGTGNIVLGSAVQLPSLALTATNGSITATNAANNFTTLAASAGGAISAVSTGSLIIGAVTDAGDSPVTLTGIASSGNVSLTAPNVGLSGVANASIGSSGTRAAAVAINATGNISIPATTSVYAASAALKGDGLAIGGILNTTGATAFETNTTGRAIDLSATPAGGTTGLSASTLGAIAASTLNISTSGSGNLTVSDATSLSSVTNLNLTAGGTGNISINAALGNSHANGAIALAASGNDSSITVGASGSVQATFGSVSMQSDRMILGGGAGSIGAATGVTLARYNPGIMSLGVGASDTGVLGLDNTELNTITPGGFLHMSTSGPISMAGALNLSSLSLSNPVSLTSTGATITLGSALTTPGMLALSAGIGNITQSAPITAAGLFANTTSGKVALDTVSNVVGTIAGSASDDDFNFKGAGNLVVGTVNGTSGITTNSHASISTDGSLTVNAPVTIGSGSILGLTAGTALAVNTALNAAGPGSLNLIAGNGGVSGGMVIAGALTVDAGSTGISLRDKAGNITQTAALSASNALIIADAGSVTLTNAGNSIAKLSGYANDSGGFTFTNAGAVEVDSVWGSNGLLNFAGPLSLTALTGNITATDVTYGISATSYPLNLTASTGQIIGSGIIKGSTVTLVAGNTINLAGTSNEASTLVASQSGGTGNITFVNNMDLAVGTVTNSAAGGAINLSTSAGAGYDIAITGSVSSNAGAITIGSSGAGSQITMPASASIASSNGVITLTADQLGFTSSTINAGTAAVNLTAANGAISGFSSTVTGSSLQANAVSGISLTTAVQTLNASNGGAGGLISISNTGTLDIQSVTQPVASTGAITIANAGNATVTGPVTTASGAISISASALDVNGSITSANGGNMALTAVPSGHASDKLNINSGAVVTSAGTITLTAGDAITVDGGATVSAGAVRAPFQNYPTLSACIANPNLAFCSMVLPSLASCIAAPATLGCSVVLPSIGTCTAAPATPGCSVVLPSLATCISAPSTPGCSVVLPSLGTCIAAPATAGCSVVLPSLATCITAPSTPGCSVVLPSLATCTAAPSTPGCSVVLPGVDPCIADPGAAGCTVELPSIATCTAAPATAGCSEVLPTIGTCTAAPATAGCSVVLPTIGSCIAAPATPGCLAVLPSIGTCVSAPATAGCSAVMPSLATCTSAPATAGCSAILPSIDTCTATPGTAGCSAVLPGIGICTSAPATAGCSAVLPSIGTCTSTPATAGCSAVLPSVASCTSAPATAGCSAVLPSLGTCTSAPGTAGCSAVLPNLATCTSAPATAGCSAVLPGIGVCTSAPATAGCSVVLPSLASCTGAPATAGCSVVLPGLGTCTSAPGTAGCSAVLPTIGACTSAPATAGCSAVFPSIGACTAAPGTAGCSVVLPSMASCTSAPGTAGCSAVLPSIGTCTASPTAPGCSAVLPSLASCTANPAIAACSVVLPTLSQCTTTPTTAGCIAVLPSLAICLSSPGTVACSAVLPSQNRWTDPVHQALQGIHSFIHESVAVLIGATGMTVRSFPSTMTPDEDRQDDLIIEIGNKDTSNGEQQDKTKGRKDHN